MKENRKEILYKSYKNANELYWDEVYMWWEDDDNWSYTERDYNDWDYYHDWLYDPERLRDEKINNLLEINTKPTLKDISGNLMNIIQKTTVVNIKDEYDILICRPSKWGNPYTHIKDRKTNAEFIVKSRKKAIECYKNWIENGDGKHLLNDLHELKGKRLACWCSPKKSCHGYILIELINKYINNKGFQI